MSAALLAYYASPGARERKSEIARAAWAKADPTEHSARMRAVCAKPEWRQKHSESTKAAWEAGAYASRDGAEHRQKLSETMKRKWASGALSRTHTADWLQIASQRRSEAWAAGKYDHPEYRRRLHEAASRARASGRYDNVYRSPSSIERLVFTTLDSLGIEHKTQFRPPHCVYVFDGYIPPDLVIEVQGTFWHVDPRFYDYSVLHDYQRNRVERDARKAQWAKDHGYRLFTIWEADIKRLGPDAALASVVAIVRSERG